MNVESKTMYSVEVMEKVGEIVEYAAWEMLHKQTGSFYAAVCVAFRQAFSEDEQSGLKRRVERVLIDMGLL